MLHMTLRGLGGSRSWSLVDVCAMDVLRHGRSAVSRPRSSIVGVVGTDRVVTGRDCEECSGRLPH